MPGMNAGDLQLSTSVICMYTEGPSRCCFFFSRSTRDSSCFTVVLNNLRVFLIFDWLQLVRDFLRMPAEKGSGTAPRQRWPSGGSDSSGGGALMPKTVKSGVVTKRSTVPVTQDRYLEVKINVTGTGAGEEGYFGNV